MCISYIYGRVLNIYIYIYMLGGAYVCVYLLMYVYEHISAYAIQSNL